MKTWEMIKALTENPKRKAKLTNDYWEEEKDYVIYVYGGVLKNEHQYNYDFRIELEDEWEIIEPEPEVVDFATAYKAYKRGKTIQSLATMDKYIKGDFCVIDGEIDGLWIISE